MTKRGIVWFRLDLRLHDNEALQDALSVCDEVYPVYVFDPRQFEQTDLYGFRKTGIHRARFLLECVADLGKQLEAVDSELYVLQGYPEEVIFEFARRIRSSWVFCNRERTRDEVYVQDRLERNLWSIGQEVRFSRGKMLYYTQDLPFPVTHSPDSFGGFRREVENYTPIRDPLPTPAEMLPRTSGVSGGPMPTLEELGFSNAELTLPASPFSGGETTALRHLEEYFVESGDFDHYAETRKKILDARDTSRLSPWLSHGCISPKKINQELLRYQKGNKAEDNASQFRTKLIWRDYLRLMGKKHGNKIFKRGGISGSPRTDLKEERDIFDKWVEGKTGVPLVDAMMNQLHETGFLPARARKVVSSFLVNDLKIEWRMGAEYFESILIDYDPCSNYVNWNYVAGVDLDSQKPLTYNLASQLKGLDPDFQYVRKWATSYRDMSDTELLQLHEEVPY